MSAPDAPRPPVPAAYAEPDDDAHRFIVTIAKCVNYREAWKLQRRHYHELVNVHPSIPLDEKRVSMRVAVLMAARREYDGARAELQQLLGCGC